MNNYIIFFVLYVPLMFHSMPKTTTKRYHSNIRQFTVTDISKVLAASITDCPDDGGNYQTLWHDIEKMAIFSLVTVGTWNLTKMVKPNLTMWMITKPKNFYFSTKKMQVKEDHLNDGCEGGTGLCLEGKYILVVWGWMLVKSRTVDWFGWPFYTTEQWQNYEWSAMYRLGEYSKGSMFHAGTRINYQWNDNKSHEFMNEILPGAMKRHVTLDLLLRNRKNKCLLQNIVFHCIDFSCSHL